LTGGPSVCEVDRLSSPLAFAGDAYRPRFPWINHNTGKTEEFPDFLENIGFQAKSQLSTSKYI
jgi:hypothetical protein